jgi:hypothetical protein
MTIIVTKGGHKEEKFSYHHHFLWLLFGLGSVYNIVIEFYFFKSKRRRGAGKNGQKCGTPCYDYVSFLYHLNMT